MRWADAFVIWLDRIKIAKMGLNETVQPYFLVFLRKNACKIKLLWYIKATLKGDLCLNLRANLVF